MKAWQQFLSDLEQELGSKAVAQWLRPLRVVRFDAANLYLEPPDPMAVSWFEEHVRAIAKTSFLNENNRPVRIHFEAPAKKGAAPSPNPFPAKKIQPDSVDPLCTLSHFVSFPGNEIALRLMKDWQAQGTPLFNPIFLYGPKGSGKTHLLLGAANEFSSQGKKVFYVKADTFTEHVVQAIRGSRMQEFRKIYRDIDILLVDDIDHLAGRAATQEEFFHTFNTLHTAGKQIVLTSKVPPSKLADIEPRLTSRFEWGISLGIEKAPIGDIITSKANGWKLPLNAPLLSFLTEKFPNDPLTALQALAVRSSSKEPLTPSAAELLLKDLLALEAEKGITPEQIIKSISTHFGITPEDLLGKAQSREFALPRQIAMYIFRHRLKMPFQAIGKFFGRDHSTVMSSVKQIQEEIDKKTPQILEALEPIPINP